MKRKGIVLNSHAKGRALMLMSSAFVCLGQLCWKLGAQNVEFLVLGLGFALYLLGAFVMIRAYKFGKMSALQPMLSMNYVFSTLIGAIVLREVVRTQMIVGILVVTLGVILIGGEQE